MLKKAQLPANILFLSILILYFGIRNVSIFFILKIKFHLYSKSTEKVCDKPMVAKGWPFSTVLFPAAVVKH